MKTQEMKTKKITALLEIAALQDEGEGSGADMGLRVESDTSEDWGEDEDGEPTCGTRTIVRLYDEADNLLLTGEILGWYSRCCSGGDQFSSWQDGDGVDADMAARTIATIMGQDVEEFVDIPEEPSEPEEAEDGEYVVLFHGWEQPWRIVGRYAEEAEARLAMIAHQRRVREANSSNAYGWDHAIGIVREGAEEDTEEIDGLHISILTEEGED